MKLVRETKIAAANREQWLESAVVKVAPILLDAKLAAPEVRVSVGFPSKRALSASNRAVGECWHQDAIEQDHCHIFVSPTLGDRIEVAGVLIHELIHAALPFGTRHNKKFASAAKACGLEGKPTATTVGAPLTKRLNALLKDLPKYPHQPFDQLRISKKQTTRLRLYECGCPIKVRVASDDFDATCNICGSPFELRANGERN